MSRFFSAVFAVFALFLAFVAAAPTPTTNAERFKNGLGPLKPRNLDRPTRRTPGNPTTSPGLPVRARIKAYDTTDPTNAVFLGYVSFLDSLGVYTYSTAVDSATIVKARLESLNPGNLDLETPPAGFAAYPELGFSGASNDNTFGPGSSSSPALVPSKATPRNSGPQYLNSLSLGTNSPTESAIWNLVDTASLEIRPQWLNSNGQPVTTYPILLTTVMVKFFSITGDVAAVRAVAGFTATPVRFNLELI